MTLRRRLLALYGGSALQRIYTRFKCSILPFEQFSGALPQSGTIVDIGCGYGYVANYLSLAAPARRVIGVDPSATRIEAARRAAGSRPNIEFLRGDVTALPPVIDAALIADVLHHIPYDGQRGVLRALFERLRPGGVLVIRETAKQPSLRYWLFHCLLEGLLYAGEEKWRFRTAGEWRTMLEAIGYAVERVTPSAWYSWYVTATLLCRKPGPVPAGRG